MEELTTVGRWIIFAGIALLLMGSMIWMAGKMELPLGRLPGDFRIQRNGFTCIAPIATSLVLSVLLTLLLNLILRQMR
jgi:hypothetical protein